MSSSETQPVALSMDLDETKTDRSATSRPRVTIVVVIHSIAIYNHIWINSSYESSHRVIQSPHRHGEHDSDVAAENQDLDLSKLELDAQRKAAKEAKKAAKASKGKSKAEGGTQT
jgi:predicted secreted acid phosphatase